MTARETTFGSPYGGAEAPPDLLHQMCEKAWTLPLSPQGKPDLCPICGVDSTGRRSHLGLSVYDAIYREFPLRLI